VSFCTNDARSSPNLAARHRGPVALLVVVEEAWVDLLPLR
jgi:hypothetical protein